jgi:hypothetical protein
VAPDENMRELVQEYAEMRHQPTGEDNEHK